MKPLPPHPSDLIRAGRRLDALALLLGIIAGDPALEAEAADEAHAAALALLEATAWAYGRKHGPPTPALLSACAVRTPLALEHVPRCLARLRLALGTDDRLGALLLANAITQPLYPWRLDPSRLDPKPRPTPRGEPGEPSASPSRVASRVALGRLTRLLGTLALLVQAGAHRADAGQTHGLALESLWLVGYWFGRHHPRADSNSVARLLSATPHAADDAPALVAALAGAVARDEWVRALMLASALARVCRPRRPLS
jgi:hypothetical protein